MDSLQQLACATCAAALMAVPAFADTINVPGDFATIQAALDAAENGDEVIVAAGTYPEAIDFLGKSVHLRSLDGAETTIIDAAGLGSSVVTCETGETPATILEGFTITGGDAVHGGGMDIVFASPTIIDCIFESNTALQGGAIRNSSASVIISGSIFRMNAATQSGGAISNTNSTCVITDCQFLQNSSGDEGGALYNVGNSVVTVSGSHFEGNAAAIGGAIYGVLSPATLTDNFLCQNQPENIVGDWNDLGGNDQPVYCQVIHVPTDFATIQAAIDSVTSSAEIVVAAGTYPEAIDLLGKVIHLHSEEPPGEGNTIIDATGLGSSAVTCTAGEQSDTIIEGFVITGGSGSTLNLMRGVETFGGGAVIVGANPVFTGCDFTTNSATVGGGLYVESASPTIIDCTIDGNSAAAGRGRSARGGVGPDPVGGGIALVDAAPSIVNCLIENNTADDGGGIFADATSLPALTDTTVCDNTPDNLEGPWDDLGGNTICIAVLGDLNDDGVVDVSDLLILLSTWGPCPACPADFNGDDVVDVSDLLILLGAWG